MQRLIQIRFNLLQASSGKFSTCNILHLNLLILCLIPTLNQTLNKTLETLQDLSTSSATANTIPFPLISSLLIS